MNRRDAHITHKGILAVILALCLGVAALAACSKTETASTDDGSVKIAYVTDFYPYASGTGTAPTGFTVDLVSRCAEDSGLNLRYLKATTLDTALDAVENGQADAAIGAYAKDAALPDGIKATNAYIDVNIGIVALENNGFESIDDLHTAKIGVLEGSAAHDWALRNLPNAEVVTYASVDEAFTGLEARNVDAVACGEPNAHRRVKVAYADAKVIGTVETTCAYVIVSSSDDFISKFNATLESMRADGTYDELYESWFGRATERGEVEARTNEQGAPTYAKR